MQISICSATEFELAPLKESLARLVKQLASPPDIQYFHTGIGTIQSSYAIHAHLEDYSPDLLIQVGIAGSFDSHIRLTEVRVIQEEYLGNSGVLEAGLWKDTFDMGLQPADLPPFKAKALINPWLTPMNVIDLKAVTAVTVDEITTSPQRIEALNASYQPVLESMEGAAMHYVALQKNQPFLQIRGVSNYVGDRNKANWQLKAAINSSCQKVYELIHRLHP